MGRATFLKVSQYRSIDDEVRIDFPPGVPVVLVGENNAGKSNLVSALDLLLGEQYPGTRMPADHDFYARNREAVPIEIQVGVEGVMTDPVTPVVTLQWRSPDPEDPERPFSMMLTNGQDNHYVSNAVREQCTAVLIGADRRLSYQLSYASQYTFLAKVMFKFHQALIQQEDVVANLQAYFSSLKEEFGKVGEFATFAQELTKQADRLSANMEYGLKIDFSAYDPSNYFHALKVLPFQDETARTFAELGTGQEQILALAFAYAYAVAFKGAADSLILVVEEPEAHLHPLAQQWVSQTIREIAAEGIQVVLTTHSPAFVEIMSLEGVVVVRKEAGATKTMQLTPAKPAAHCRATGAEKATPENILSFYHSASTLDIVAGLFARKVVLVEGQTEALAVPTYFERSDFLASKTGIAVIPVHGANSLAKWLRFFTAYGIPTYVVVDNDLDKGFDPGRHADLFAALRVPPDQRPSLLKATGLEVKPSFAVVGPSFEPALRGLFGPAYAELEEEARLALGPSGDGAKPLIARFVAERIPLEGAAPEALAELAQAITAL